MLLITVALIGSSCCSNDDNLPPSETNAISVLIVDETTHTFEGGKIYNYQNDYPTYTLKVENVPPNDVGYIKVNYEEADELLYHATQIWMGMGEIIVPSPLTPAQDFEHVLTNDYVSLPTYALELTNGPSKIQEVEKYWARIQGLKVVRDALQQNNTHVHYFVQNLSDGLTQTNKWVFIVKQ